MYGIRIIDLHKKHSKMRKYSYTGAPRETASELLHMSMHMSIGTSASNELDVASAMTISGTYNCAKYNGTTLIEAKGPADTLPSFIEGNIINGGAGDAVCLILPLSTLTEVVVDEFRGELSGAHFFRMQSDAFDDSVVIFGYLKNDVKLNDSGIVLNYPKIAAVLGEIGFDSGSFAIVNQNPSKQNYIGYADNCTPVRTT